MAMPKLQMPGSMQGGGGTWEPTVVYLLLLVIAEIVIFGFISRLLR